MTEKEKFISIKVKLLGIILPVICIIITVLTGLMYNVSKKVNQSNAQDLLKTSVEIQSAEIEAWLNRNLAAFNVMKQALEQWHLMNIKCRTFWIHIIITTVTFRKGFLLRMPMGRFTRQIR